MKKILALVLAAVMMLGCMTMFTSCGDKEELNFGKDYLAAATQLEALNGLKKGDADIAVIDSVMAGYYMNTGDSYKDFQILSDIVLAEEQYGIGAKKGNDALIGKINEAMIALAATDAKTIATTYGLASELLVNADSKNPQKDADDNSWDDVVASKEIVIGYTLFAPIAYMDGDGTDANLIGFDIDLAKAVVDYLNEKYDAAIEIEFMEIEWDAKESLLENGTIDLVWNGMTITDERVANMAMSIPYLANKQVAIVAKDKAADFGTTMDSFVEYAKDCIVTFENGSAGEGVVIVSEEE